MNREVSTDFTRAVYAQETDEVFLILLEIISDEIEGGIVRLVNNYTPITSNGNEYTPCAFRCVLPDEKEDGIPQASIEIDNVDRRIGLAIRQMRTRPHFVIKVVRASNPDLIELDYNDFLLNSADISSKVVSGSIGPNNALDQTFPKDTYTPSLFPGMF